MKKFLLFFPLLALLFSCSSNEEVTPNKKTATTKVVFNIVENDTRAANTGATWPTTQSETDAAALVEQIYTTPKSAGLSFFVNNYKVNLTNDKATDAITTWDGSTTLSLTETNNITVTLTAKEEGAFPVFATANGTIDISNLDLDAANPIFTTSNYSGDIEIKTLTVDESGNVNVTIQVNLTYDSYLLVAPSSSYSVLTNVKGFTALKFGGSNGKDFKTATYDKKTWFYYWGHGNEYVLGNGTFARYGFNLYSDGSNDIKVKNGFWYALFTSLNSIGEGDDDATSDTDPDKNSTHTIGGTNGIDPNAGSVSAGGAIR